MISRRRLLVIAAGMAGVGCSGFSRQPKKTEWRGRAFGAEVAIAVYGSDRRAQNAIDAARDTMRRLERYFSLYDPASLLSGLNRTGRLSMPPEVARLITLCDHLHAATDGLFDPTVQPLFALHAKSAGTPTPDDSVRTRALIGWNKVRFNQSAIWLTQPRMALTFNGIAQGFATDRICEVLAAHGFDRFLVNLGEYRTGRNDAQLAIEDIDDRRLSTLTITNEAVATSSSHGFTFPDGTSHIFRPLAGASTEPEWRTVSVVSRTAAVADALSTALILAPGTELARRLQRQGLLRRAVLQDFGNLIVRI